MKKIIVIGATLLLSAFLLDGCNTNATPSHASEDAKSENYIYFPTTIQPKEMQKILKSVGESEGWRITEYKSNAMIAEKLDNPDAKAVTITFSKDFFYTTPRNTSLESAIKNALPKDGE